LQAPDMHVKPAVLLHWQFEIQELPINFEKAQLKNLWQ
jgi:hypothetical protein